MIILIGKHGLLAYVIIDPKDGWEILNSKDDIKTILTEKLSEEDTLIVDIPTDS